MTALIHWLYPGDGATCLVANLVVQIAAAVLVAALVSGTLLRRWPAAQHAVWLACLGFVLVCPLTAFSSARKGMFLVSLTPATQAPAVNLQPAGRGEVPADARKRGVPPHYPSGETPLLRERTVGPADMEPGELPDQPRGPATESRIQPKPESSPRKIAPANPLVKPFDFRALVATAIGIWAAGVLFLAARLLHGVLAVYTLRGASAPLDPSALGDVLAEVRRSLGSARLPPIGLSDRIATPVVAGLFRPAVLLPASLAAAIAPGRIRDILLHECAHVARRDPWVVVLQRLVAVVYWPHPLVHVLNRQLARCREEVCDNWVLRAVRPADYADTLLEVAIHCRDRFGVDMPIGLFDVHGKVEDRVRRLLDRRRDGGIRLPARARWGVLAAAAIFLAVAASFPLVAPARAEKQPAKENQAAGKKPTVKQAAASSSEQPPPAGKSEADKDQSYVEGMTVDSGGKPLEGVQIHSSAGAEAQTQEVVQQDDPLPAQAAVRLGTARYRYGSRIASMGVSADGKLAVVSCGVAWFSGLYWPARVFDLTDGRCLHSIPNEPGTSAEAVSLSPDGKTLAVKDDAFLYFLDAATGKKLRTLKYITDAGGGRSGTDWITFTPDGKRVAVTLMGDTVQLIDVQTAKKVRTIAPGAAATACVFSPDGKWMATGGYEVEDGRYSVRLWDVGTGKQVRQIPVVHFPSGNGMDRALAFSPDGTTLAGGGWGDARLHLWDAATGKELTAFPKLAGDVRSVAFAPDGKTVAAAADSIYFFDPATGKERLHIEQSAYGLAFSQDGSALTGAVSGAIYRWDAVSGRQLTPAAAQDSAVEQILVSADGRRVFTTDHDGNLYVWDAAGGKAPRRIAGEAGRGIVASPDGRYLAWTVRTDYGNSRIRIYDVTAERSIDPVLRSSEGFREIGGIASLVAFLPDDKTLLTLGGGVGDATVRLWDVNSWKEQRSFAVVPPESVGDPGRAMVVVPFDTNRRIALSPDGKMLAIGPDFPDGFNAENGDAPVRLWGVMMGKPGPKLEKPVKVANESYKAHSQVTRKSVPELRSGSECLKSIDGRAFSPDGRLLVDWAEHPFGPSQIDHVYVWETATGRAVASLAAGPQHGAANAAFSPDGRTLATASADGIVRLWDTATWKVRGELRGHRDRVTALAFGPDGRLFTGGLDTVVLGWNVQPTRGKAIGK